MANRFGDKEVKNPFGDTEVTNPFGDRVTQEPTGIPGEIPDYRLLNEQGQLPVDPTVRSGPSRGFGEYAIGGLDALWSTLTSIPAALLGGPQGALPQIVEEIQAGNYGDPAAAQRVLEAYMSHIQSGMVQPQTDVGQDIMKTVGEATQALPPILGAPNAIMSGANVLAQPTMKATPIIDSTRKIIEKFQGKEAKARREVITDRIRAGDQDIDTIVYELNKKGDLVPNKRLARAQRAFENEEDAIKATLLFDTMTNATKKGVNKMLDIVQKSRRLGDRYLRENRPVQVIGEAFANRAKVLLNLKKEAQRRLRPSLTRLSKQEFDMAPILNEFIMKLGEPGIRILRNQEGKIEVDLSSARVKLSDVLPKDELERVLNMMDSPMNGKEAHEFKRFVREFVDYQTGVDTVQQKVSPVIEDAIKNASRQINEKLGTMDSAYAKANKVYASIANPLSIYRKYLKTTDIDSEIANAKLGQLAKRLGTNFTSRSDIMELIKVTDDGLKNNGLRHIKMKDNIGDMVDALARIEKAFDLEEIQAPFGITSRISQGIRTSQADPTAIIEIVADKLASMNKIDFDERMKVLRELSKERK